MGKRDTHKRRGGDLHWTYYRCAKCGAHVEEHGGNWKELSEQERREYTGGA